jgi:hypothetical protein
MGEVLSKSWPRSELLVNVGSLVSRSPRKAAREVAIVQDTECHGNQAVVDELLSRQIKTGEGCFFAGLGSLSHALNPDYQLPSAQEIWESARQDYDHLLLPDKLLIAHDKLAQAFIQIHGAWGIKLSDYQLSDIGESLIGESMLKIFGPPKLSVPNNGLISTRNTPLPYSILLHQAGRNDSHFITEDGSQAVAEARDSYDQTNPPHRVIALFTFKLASELR